MWKPLRIHICRYWGTNHKRSVQVERGGDHRRECDGGSHPPGSVHTAKVQCIKCDGIPEREERLMIFDRHANLKYKFGNRHFWSRGYYVSTVGLNEATIAKYVREQYKHDQMMDKITTKEAEDPFRGSLVIDAPGFNEVKTAP